MLIVIHLLLQERIHEDIKYVKSKEQKWPDHLSTPWGSVVFDLLFHQLSKNRWNRYPGTSYFFLYLYIFHNLLYIFILYGEIYCFWSFCQCSLAGPFFNCFLSRLLLHELLWLVWMGLAGLHLNKIQCFHQSTSEWHYCSYMCIRSTNTAYSKRLLM